MIIEVPETFYRTVEFEVAAGQTWYYNGRLPVIVVAIVFEGYEPLVVYQMQSTEIIKRLDKNPMILRLSSIKNWFDNFQLTQRTLVNKDI